MHCPQCRKTRVCAAIPTTALGEPSGQRWYRVGHDDIVWFRRGRHCLTCGHEWLTAELPEELVDELVELRKALADVKRHAETYVTQAKSAASALDDLTDSLAILRALDVYEHEPLDVREISLEGLAYLFDS